MFIQISIYRHLGDFHLLAVVINTSMNMGNKCLFESLLSFLLSIYPAIPLLGIYPENTVIQKDTCTRMFIAALFTIARSWKQPKWTLVDEWIKKMWHTYTMKYYSAIKKIKFCHLQQHGWI